MFDLREEILDHYKYPRNFGLLEEATHKAKQGNASCGDKVEFFLKVHEGIVEEIKWQGEGCAISTAAASMLSEEVIGKELEEIMRWDEKKIFSLVGEISSGRIKCAMLPLVTIKSLVE
jgi:nitrogen fixation NifU-like protein